MSHFYDRIAKAKIAEITKGLTWSYRLAPGLVCQIQIADV